MLLCVVALLVKDNDSDDKRREAVSVEVSVSMMRKFGLELEFKIRSNIESDTTGSSRTGMISHQVVDMWSWPKRWTRQR